MKDYTKEKISQLVERIIYDKEYYSGKEIKEALRECQIIN